MGKDLQQRNRNYFEFWGPDSYTGILFISWSGTKTSSDLYYSPSWPRIPVLSRGSLLCSNSLLVQVTEFCWWNDKICSMRIKRYRVGNLLSKFGDVVYSLKTHQHFYFLSSPSRPIAAYVFKHIALLSFSTSLCLSWLLPSFFIFWFFSLVTFL